MPEKRDFLLPNPKGIAEHMLRTGQTMPYLGKDEMLSTGQTTPSYLDKGETMLSANLLI